MKKEKNTSILNIQDPTEKSPIFEWLESYSDPDRKVAAPVENKIDSEYEYSDFSPNLYLTLYPDLKENGVITDEQALSHLINHGLDEGRIYSFKGWAEYISINSDLLVSSLAGREDEIIKLNRNGSDLQLLLQVVEAKTDYPYVIYSEKEKNSQFYYELAKTYLLKNKKDEACKFLKLSLFFSENVKALELLGNYYLDNDLFEQASIYYSNAIELGGKGSWLCYNYLKCLLECRELDKAFDLMSKSVSWLRDDKDFLMNSEGLIERIWMKFYDKQLRGIYNTPRSSLIEKANTFANKVYDFYHSLYKDKTFPEIEQDNIFKSVLIIGDWHIKQCKRYRIDQKVEQLESQGIKVDSINWTELKNKNVNIPLYDTVIFYRTPAVPEVIKAIAQVNAVGKNSIYEIDDYIFGEEYPQKISTYGSYLGLSTYKELIRGMTLFNSCAKLCKFGMASTMPLQNELKELVSSGVCLLHRNGLDKLNYFDSLTNVEKSTIDIFYGSGTQAHNSDFENLALPALRRLLSEFTNVRLVVMGFLKLPDDFLVNFKKQVKLLEPVKSELSYYATLAASDVSIAVLESDKVTDCKSELKWFEAACFKIPSVVSSTKNYLDVIDDNKTALLATTPEDWYNKLHLLISNKNHRLEIGTAAFEHVTSNYSIESLGQELVASISALNKPKKATKKVALVNVFFPPQSIGGATRVVEDNFNVLLRDYSQEIDLCVFTANSEFLPSHQLMSYNHKGVRVYRATTLWREHMDWHPKDEKMYELFSQFLEIERPEIIHFHCVQRLTASIVEAAKDSGIPYIITAHDAWWISDFQFLVDHNDKVYLDGHPDPYETIELPPNITREQSIERKQYLKSLLRGAASVLTVSESFADIYRKNGISNIKAIPNGISDEIQWLPKDTSYTDKVVCAHIGGMSEHKGYHLFKEALKQLQPKNIEALVVDHSKDDGYTSVEYWGNVKVTFIGRVKQNSIVNLYQKIDVLFAPSIWPESFGLVTREAAACGCWIVASDIGGIGEDVLSNQNGFLITPTLAMVSDALYEINTSKVKYKSYSKSKEINLTTSQVKIIFGEHYAR